MRSFGLTVTLQHSITGLPSWASSNNKCNNFYPNNHNFLSPQPISAAGPKGFCLNTKKVANFCRIKASTEGTSSMSTTFEKLGVKIEKNPPESRLSEIGVRQWPKWGCPPSNFPWTYEAKETCYLLQGKVKVYPEGSTEPVEIGAGDLVVFPKGMKCTWDVSEAVDKHYKFE